MTKIAIIFGPHSVFVKQSLFAIISGPTLYNPYLSYFSLNMEQPMPSLILDHILILIMTKEVYQSIGYFLNRFRRSVFGFKTRPWTVFLFAKKGLDLGAEEVLVQYIEAADQSGLFLDSLGKYSQIL